MGGVTFERLPPERQIVAPSAASAGSCCCCCCCCLHTVGSVIGALTGKTPKPLPDPVPTAVIGTDKVEPRYTVTKEYWVTVLVLCTIAAPIFVYAMTRHQRVEPLEWAFFYAIFFPVIQLIASVIVGIRNGASSRPGRNERLRHLGSITARAFIGGMIGIIVMVIGGTLLFK